MGQTAHIRKHMNGSSEVYSTLLHEAVLVHSESHSIVLLEHSSRTFSEEVLAVFVIAADSFRRFSVGIAGAVIVPACAVFAVFLVVCDYRIGQHYFQIRTYQLSGFGSCFFKELHGSYEDILVYLRLGQCSLCGIFLGKLVKLISDLFPFILHL